MTPAERVAEILNTLRQQGWYRPTEQDDPLLGQLESGDFINLTLRLEALLQWLLADGGDETTPPASNAFIVVLVRRLRDELLAIENGARSTLLSKQGPGRNSLGADPMLIRLKLMIGAHSEAFAAAYPPGNASPRNRAIADAVEAGGHKMAPRTVGHHVEWFQKGRALRLHQIDWGDSEGWIADFLVEGGHKLTGIVGLDVAKQLSLSALTRQAAEIAARFGK